MNIKKIKQELRRSACEEEYPMFLYLSGEAAEAAVSYLPENSVYTWPSSGDQKRTFFLLVAEAM